MLSINRLLERRQEKFQRYHATCRICGDCRKDIIARICNSCRELRDYETIQSSDAE